MQHAEERSEQLFLKIKHIRELLGYSPETHHKRQKEKAKNRLQLPKEDKGNNLKHFVLSLRRKK